MLSQEEINMLLGYAESLECDDEIYENDQPFFTHNCYRTTNPEIKEEKKMDYVLLPELKHLHENLRKEEAGLSTADKTAAHMEFVKHCEKLINYSNVSRKEGLLALEELASEMDSSPETAFDRDMILLIVDGCAPEMVEKIMLLKFFSTEQTTIQGIKNLMSIYALLGIQAGDNPRILLQMVKNMIPEDVRETAESIGEEPDSPERLNEVDVDGYCVGDTRLLETDLGYPEVIRCEEMFICLDNRAVQRYLRDVNLVSLIKVMQVLSGLSRRVIFDNVSSRLAQDLVGALREDDPADEKTYYLHTNQQLEQIKKAAIELLNVLDELNTSGEIVISRNFNEDDD